MGLDHGLIRRPISQDADLVEWRKEWWLREWFAECLHRFQDNGETVVHCDDLETLVCDIENVLDEPERAKEFFPQWEGKYNEYFFERLREVKEQIQNIIDGTNWDTEQVLYWEWY